MVQNVSICFYPKKRQGEGDLVFVYLRITVRKEGSEKPDKVELSTGKKVDVRKWSAVANRLVGKSEDVKSVNDYFNILEGKVNNAHNYLMRLDHEITAEKIKLLVEGKPLEPIRTILPVFKEHNDRMKSLIGKDYAYGTWQRYETLYDHTAAFMKAVYKQDDFDIRKLDLEFLQKYEFWLKTVRDCNHNSTMKLVSSYIAEYFLTGLIDSIKSAISFGTIFQSK